jgi:hypothetical protein
MSWPDVVFYTLDVPIQPAHNPALFWTLTCKSLVIPLGLQDIHVVWRVQILFVPAIGAKQLASCRRESSPLLRHFT